MMCQTGKQKSVLMFFFFFLIEFSRISLSKLCGLIGTFCEYLAKHSLKTRTYYDRDIRIRIKLLRIYGIYGLSF